MKYAIINTIDRPCARLVVEIIDGKAYYMSRATENGLANYDGMDLRPDTTSLEDFGFEITEHNHVVEFRGVRESVAKYRDGSPRPWQGEFYFTLPKVDLSWGKEHYFQIYTT